MLTEQIIDNFIIKTFQEARISFRNIGVFLKMGRRRYAIKLLTTIMQVYEKNREEQKVHKPSSWSLADYLIRSFEGLGYLRERKSDFKFYIERNDQISKVIEKYAAVLERLLLVLTIGELHSILKPLIASNGVVDIVKYNTTAKPAINLEVKEVIEKN